METFDLGPERWVGVRAMEKREHSKEVVCKGMECSGNM